MILTHILSLMFTVKMRPQLNLLIVINYQHNLKATKYYLQIMSLKSLQTANN